MQLLRLCRITLIGLIAAAALAHEREGQAPIVIDTDMGLDDAVTLALALQNPHVEIAAIVASAGVADEETCTAHLERILCLFNRQEIPLYAPAEARPPGVPPPFRSFVEKALGAALPASPDGYHRPFSPAAYALEGHHLVVLALGPLTNLAAALRARPELRAGLQRVIISGAPAAGASWNAQYDPQAWAAVTAAGIPLAFVVPSDASRKPDSWRMDNPAIGEGTSIGEDFLKRLLAVPQVRQHYVASFANFHDELVFLYQADPGLFSGPAPANVFSPANREGILELFTRLISAGRQQKQRVLLSDDPLPDRIFQEDIRRRKARIIANNGRTEWLAQVLTNELHQHLGVYSTIGAKMGLRAAELLNAPQHAMTITSHVAAGPPTSCLNDGLIVSTGCTPGRGLFTHVPGPPDCVKVTFAYNGRRLTLRLKDEYQRRIKTHFERLLQEHGLDEPEHWAGVRGFGLEIWENWHRRDLFEVAATP